jgi:hypothetical protein
VEEPTAEGAYITKVMITLHQHFYHLHNAQINPKQGKILKQINFK